MRPIFPLLTVLTAILLASQLIIPALSSGPILRLTVHTTKQSYNVGEDIEIYGALYYEWQPSYLVSDIVTLQVNYPSTHGLCMLRTLPTASLEFKTWDVEILSLTPCDGSGDPRSTFLKGTLGYFSILWKNNDDISHYVIIALTLVYGNGVPFMSYAPTSGALAPGEDRSGLFSVPISTDALDGPAKAYASALVGWPSAGGYAYSPEKSAIFAISSSLGMAGSSVSLGVGLLSEMEPNYNSTLSTLRQGTYVGNYTVYASSRILGTQQATNTTQFEVMVLGDITGDLLVDGQDFQLVKRAVPSTPGSPKWRPECDLNGDGIVDGQDFAKLKKFVGNYGVR